MTQYKVIDTTYSLGQIIKNKCDVRSHTISQDVTLKSCVEDDFHLQVHTIYPYICETDHIRVNCVLKKVC